MELVSNKVNVNFMGVRYVGFLCSISLIAFSLFLWFDTGEDKFGVDFVGGSDVAIRFDQDISIGEVRQALDSAGLTGAVVQEFEGEGGNDFSIRLKASEEEGMGRMIRDALGEIEGKTFDLLKEDFVGPLIGEQIRQDGIKAMLIALLCMLVYISFRFEWRFALAAIAAIMHDIIITTGLFIFGGGEISAAVLAALLTIIGYSLNDTIVVFDRVRENLGVAQKGGERRSTQSERELSRMNLVDLVNMSINQTLSRTVLTSLTTLFVVSTLWLFGGGAVADLAFALVIGVIVGTYSSVFVACPAVLLLAQIGGAAPKVSAPSTSPSDRKQRSGEARL